MAGDIKHSSRLSCRWTCSPDDTSNYLSVLTDDDAEWAALAPEIQAIADGATVEKIEGNEKTRAIFFFPHSTLERCGREVFVCVEGVARRGLKSIRKRLVASGPRGATRQEPQPGAGPPGAGDAGQQESQSRPQETSQQRQSQPQP